MGCAVAGDARTVGETRRLAPPRYLPALNVRLRDLMAWVDDQPTLNSPERQRATAERGSTLLPHGG